jgi:two-component system nitrate/nitrite response regulator NarL
MNVVICDDHLMFGESLAIVLEARGHTVVACTAEPAAAVEAVTNNKVDACLMDLNFPNASGFDGIREVLKSSPDTRVVVLSAFVDEPSLKAAVDLGATWCAVKSGDLGELVDGVAAVCESETAMAGRNHLSPDAQVVSFDRWTRDPLARFLTAREREVLEGLARGESTSSLARTLGVSSATVRTHVQSMLCKLGVHSRLEAVAFAVSRNLVEPPRQRSAG